MVRPIDSEYDHCDISGDRNMVNLRNNTAIEIPKILFYLCAGFVLASITWSAINHSAVTGDYALSVILLGMMFFVVGQFLVDRWRPEYGGKDFHPSKLWKMPRMTTRGGLWLRVGFRTMIGAAVFAALATVLVLTTTAQPAFLVLLGMLLVLRIPHLYWSMRGRYELTQITDKSGTTRSVLHYTSGSSMRSRAFWLTPTLMSAAGVALAAAGVLLN